MRVLDDACNLCDLDTILAVSDNLALVDDDPFTGVLDEKGRICR